MMRCSVLLLLPAVAAAGCTSNLNCSLNGVCNAGSCVCDKPWGGEGCGVLQYKVTPVLGKDLYPHNLTGNPKSGPCKTKTTQCDALNTWNGPIAYINGKYHMYNPLYRKGSLIGTIDMMYGVADNIVGPYTWTSLGNMGANPAFVVYNESGVTKYSLWVGGSVHVATDPAGPFTKVGPGPGGNPAPIYHNGVWYATSQRTSEVVTVAKLGDDWTHFADIKPRIDAGTQEDPFMWVDSRGNWHIINHAYSTAEYKNCGSSIVSAHVFSEDGKTWHMLEPSVEPYSHTVKYEDGTSHTYTTLERPNMHFNAAKQPTYINLAADMMTQDEGCPNYDVCPAKHTYCACTNCKYADHAGSIIIALDV